RRQNIQLVRLDEMSDCDIGMLTTVLIGNSSTFIQEGLMITPRGYANKYNSLTGETKDGEKAGISLSMGLEGWYACLRRYVQENEGLTLEKIADYFGVVVGEVLNAIAAGDDAGEHKAAHIQPGKLNDVVSACQPWGRLRGIVRAEAGAVTELFLHAEDFQQRGDWLNIETDAFHCHINWSKVDSAYLACREGKSYGVNFIDNKGRLVFRLLLIKENGDFSADKLATYWHTWKTLAEESSQ
ncbi:MAG: precorrin-3B C(17)-methyltransferase, partial [Methyloprofundus sp.]|nr:precorrin-3B C(17)-methyltransferase [Methyloprofundus sp.]